MTQPLLIKDILAKPLLVAPHAEIVSAGHGRFSYREFATRINRLAHALTSIGIGRGDTVAVLDWDTHRYLECFFAVPMLGAILHTVNIRLSPAQILYTINHAKDDVIIVHADFWDLLVGIAPQIERDVRFILVQDGASAASLETGPDVDGQNIVGVYEEMLAAAEKIRSAGVMKNPVGGAYAAGWNLAQEFNNMFLGYGGAHFESGSANPNVSSKAGIDALNMMKSLSEYMNPDFLTHDSNATNAEYRAGNIALLNMWGSRAASQTTAEGVTDAVKNGHAVAGPMTVGGGSTAASTLWWDGWTVAKNVSDAEAEATFIAMMNGIRPSMMEDEAIRTQAVWLIDGYTPTDAAIGVFEAAKMGTTPYPMLPYMGLLHTALGAELPDFMQGKESAEQALADVEAAYIAAAKEKGFLN